MSASITRLVVYLLPVGVLLCGAAGMWVLVAQRQPPPREEPDPTGVPVEVVVAEQVDRRVVVTGHGSVQPRYEVSMEPQVEGRAVWVHPELAAGAVFDEGEVHPVNIFPRPIVSADWPGAWSDAMRETFGGSCIPLVLNGCCGNINPWDPFNPDYVPDHQRMGGLLAKTTQAVIENLPYEEDLSLDWKVHHVKLPIRDVEPELLAQSQKILEENPEPKWSEETPNQIDSAWMRAGSILSVHLRKERVPELDYEIQVLRVGKTAFVGLPGEPFVEGQLQLKMASPTYPTYIAHCTSHYVGYLPIPDAFPRGGHEVETRFWAKLEPEALEMVVDAATEVLQEVFES